MERCEDRIFFERMTGAAAQAPDDELSPYAVRKGIALTADARSSGVPVDAEAFRRSAGAGNCSRVLDVLYKYPYLDRASLEACLSSGGKAPALDAGKAWDALRRLRDFGIAVTWRHGDFCFYSLSGAARRQMESAKRYKTHVPSDDAPEAEILGLAGLCRWHAHSVSSASVGLNVIRQNVMIAGRERLLDSYMEFTRSIRYRLFAYPVPRDGDAERLRATVLESWQMQRESLRKGQASLTVLVAPSLADAAACHAVFQRIGETGGKSVYYALDSRRGPSARGLRGIYRFEEDGTLRSIGIE